MNFPIPLSLFYLVIFISCLTTTQANSKFDFPPGTNWDNATPAQMAQAVFAAVKGNPDQAPSIAAAGVLAAAKAKRWALKASQDKEQENVPVSTSLEIVAQILANAAKLANPAMANQIDLAIACDRKNVYLFGFHQRIHF